MRHPTGTGSAGEGPRGADQAAPAAQGRLCSKGILTREEGVSSKGQGAGEAQIVGCWGPAEREAQGLGTGGQGLLCLLSPWDLILSCEELLKASKSGWVCPLEIPQGLVEARGEACLQDSVSATEDGL